MIRLLLDMCVDRRVRSLLDDKGHDVVHVGEVGMARAPDSAVMARARAERRVLVTHDSDFAQLLARSGDVTPSVVHVRAPTATFDEVALLVSGVLEATSQDLEAGAIVSASERGARVHLLPVVRRNKDPSGAR